MISIALLEEMSDTKVKKWREICDKCGQVMRGPFFKEKGHYTGNEKYPYFHEKDCLEFVCPCGAEKHLKPLPKKVRHAR